MIPPFMPLDFLQDPLNDHHDDRKTCRDDVPVRTGSRERLDILVARLGYWGEELHIGRPSEPATQN